MSRSSASGTDASAIHRQGDSKRKKDYAFVNHDAAMSFLESRINVERVRPGHIEKSVWELDRMRALLQALGDPQDTLEIIHIAGSKGKGSVCNMLEGALEASGYTTGVFTSPHLLDIRERIRVGGRLVSEDLFDSCLAQCKLAAQTVEQESPKNGKVTYFEMLTALAFVVFASEAVDFVVLETGIGGRVDCTNVVKPRICGLTSIQLEHTQVLGDTIEQIAAEKAGILKPGVIAVSTPQTEEVVQVFREHASRVGAPIRLLGDDVLYTKRFQSGASRGPHARVCVGDGQEDLGAQVVGRENEVGFEHVSVPLMGMHQADNCALVLALILELRQMGFEFPERRVIAGFEQMNKTGRLEQVMKSSRVYIDGAHTPSSVRETLLAVGAHLNYDSLIVIFGCADDKDFEGMLEELDRGADKIYFTKATDNSRAVKPQELYDMFVSKEYKSMAEHKPDVRSAVNSAAKAITGHDLILVLGSFYLAGELKALVEARKPKR